MNKNNAFVEVVCVVVDGKKYENILVDVGDMHLAVKLVKYNRRTMFKLINTLKGVNNQ